MLLNKVLYFFTSMVSVEAISLAPISGTNPIPTCRSLMVNPRPRIVGSASLNSLTIREPQLSRYMSALLNASNQPGYLFFSGKTFQQLYCPKCIYVGASFKDSPSTSNSVNINLGGSALTPRHALPAKEEITSFQNRLLSYRLLNHDKVATANFRVPGFRPEVSIVADVLAAAIVDQATQSHAHRLSHAHDVLTAEPSCEHCHELQQPQSEGVVQDV